MKKIVFKSTALLLSALLSFSAFAEEQSAKQILDKMSNAVNHLNYELAFVQTTPTAMGSYLFSHIKQDNKTFARLFALDGIQQEIIQRDNLVSYFQPNIPAFTIQSSDIVDALPPVIRVNFDKLGANYEFIKIGKDRIAGRLVDTIRIVPKDDFRYQYLAFIDEENNLLLRSDMLDREGNLLDQFRVVTLYIDNSLKGLTNYLNKITVPPLLNESKQDNKGAAFTWKANWLPAGFELVRHSQEVSNDEIIDSALYSDGLFTFNLYVANADSTKSDFEPLKQGALTIYSETIGNKEITFIGQLPIAAAKRIIQEIKFNQ